MSWFNKFYKKGSTVTRTLEIDETLYWELERLSEKVYDASINKLVNVAIEDILKNENIKLYEKKNTLYVARSFLIREQFWEGLCDLKKKYGISIRLLVNISVRNGLIEEGIIKEQWKDCVYRIVSKTVKKFLLTNRLKACIILNVITKLKVGITF